MTKLKLEEVISELRNNLLDLTPSKVNVYICFLAAEIYQMADAMAKAAQDYHFVWLRYRSECGTNGETDHKAKCTNEYKLKMIYELRQDAINEMIQSAKKRLRILEMENHNTM